MKRTVSILALALVASTVAAQDIYQISQNVSDSIDHIIVNSGWHVKMRPSTEEHSLVTLNTTCADFFEEGNEPHLANVATSSRLIVEANTILPSTTEVELAMPAGIYKIELLNDAYLQVDNFEFAEKVSISLDEGATLRLGGIRADALTINATSGSHVDLQSFNGGRLDVWVADDASVDFGDITADRCNIHLARRGHSNITASDTARHIRVNHTIFDGRPELSRLNLRIGVSSSSGFVSSNVYNSPFNLSPNGRSYSYIINFCSNDIRLRHNFFFNAEAGVGYRLDMLANPVAYNGTTLVMDGSYGSQMPIQSLSTWYVSMPISIGYNLFGSKSNSIVATLEPTLNLGSTKLNTSTLGPDGHYTTTKTKVDLYRRFNVRATFGIKSVYLNLIVPQISFYVDLLPTYHQGIGADGIHTAGVSIAF